MADLEKIAEDLSALTVLEAAELATLLEEKWGVSAAAPVFIIAELPIRGAQGLSEMVSSRDSLLIRINELEREKLLLKARTQKMSALIAENNRLRDLLGSAAKLQENVFTMLKEKIF